MRNILIKRRGFEREAKVESRVFCPCELCCLRFGHMLYSKTGGEPLNFRRIPGFAGNFTLRRRQALRHLRASHQGVAQILRRPQNVLEAP